MDAPNLPPARFSATPSDPVLDRDRLEAIIAAAEPVGIQYASILAGGVCSAGCYFCLGAAVRGHESAHCGPAWDCFIEAAASRVRPYLSLSGVSSDPTLLPQAEVIVEAARRAGFVVALHTNGMADRPALYEAADRLTISCHSFAPAAFGAIMNRPPASLAAVCRTLAAHGPSGRVKLSATYLPENAAEISSGRWFTAGQAFGVHRFVVRRRAGDFAAPELPARARPSGDFAGCPVFELDGAQVTVWDYAVANQRLPALLYWPDGRVESVTAWADLISTQIEPLDESIKTRPLEEPPNGSRRPCP